MRAEKARDYWKAATHSEDNNCNIKLVELRGVSGLGDISIEVKGPITFICGSSGSGKTTILQSIYAALSPAEAELNLGHSLRPRSGVCNIEIGDQTHSYEFATPLHTSSFDHDLEVLYLDCTRSASIAQNHFRNLDDIDGLANGAPAYDCKEEEIGKANYITGKRYSKITFHAVEDENLPSALPFVTVSEGQSSYDARHMGLGELSALYILWATISAPDGGLLLLEEPECFISPASQKAALDVVAEATNKRKKKLTVICTTHSPEMAGRSGPRCSNYLYRTRDGVQRATEVAAYRIRRSLGLNFRKDILLLVEDLAALRFAKLWLAHEGPEYYERSSIYNAQCDGNIKLLIQKFPICDADFTIVGLFDGDLAKEGEIDKPHPHRFLPGDRPIEKIFRDIVEEDTESLGSRLEVLSIDSAIAALGGKDHHDWFYELGNLVQRSPEQLMAALFQCWLSKGDNREHSRERFASLLTALPDSR